MNSQSPARTVESSTALWWSPPSSASSSVENIGMERISGTKKKEGSSGKFCGDNIILIDCLY